jgi:hypothetical protein
MHEESQCVVLFGNNSGLTPTARLDDPLLDGGLKIN